jgi:DsbC/DsbD-like thiol-disulfide interchange protein
MHLKALVAVGLMTTAAPVFAQSLLGRPTPQHASVAASASAPAVAPGGKVTLWADVSPFPAIHIYAAGAKEFTPVSLVVTPNSAVKTAKPVYPKPDSQTSGDAAPAYTQRFRIALPVTIAPGSPKGPLTIAGAVNYQACDDRLCYPVSSAPVSWHVDVR